MPLVMFQGEGFEEKICPLPTRCVPVAVVPSTKDAATEAHVVEIESSFLPYCH